MLFKGQFHAGLRDGSITLTFRAWSRPQVKVGGRYRVGAIGLLEVDAVDRVALRDVSERDAGRSGFADRAALVAALERAARRKLRPGDRLFRVRLHFVGPDQRPGPSRSGRLGADEADALEARLERMDRLPGGGAWTAATLRLIEKSPRVRAAELAASLDAELRPFKANVRKLKALGLTVSHEVGYELSPRGRALLARRRKLPYRGHAPRGNCSQLSPAGCR